MPLCRLIPILILAGVFGASARADPLPVAVFDIEFVNYSQEVEFGATNAAERARARMLSDAFRTLVAQSGRYRLVDMTTAETDLALHGNPFSCNACEADIAARLGAERSFTGAVQKLSVLVQTIVIRERDTRTGEVLALYQTDIRGNTDEAWRRGLAWLMKNRMLPGTAALDGD
ncbi:MULTISPECIES: DUF3280 domain-containing protein [Rhodovulum]|uniref:Uncharacterized protein DUF2380 n=2 Tax=Rhodovulum TaxID=34008 RepID=A0A8E2VJR9_9RHOB|nr:MULTISPECIES: DUF3280 domain-containing protein [Rhodovulum]PTW49903.1 uncharacterized protein DUF2380 [Rhodovulum kholense]RAP39881.1 hypothetical protein BYZ73_18045 [Rhodovulum viride]